MYNYILGIILREKENLNLYYQNKIIMNNLNKYKILLADDEPQNLKFLFDALATEDYQIFSAPNGAVAIDLTVKHLPDAIIMDWDMPVINGIEAIQQLRKIPETKFIPIIMATGKMISTENLKMALNVGANDYIRKPFDVVEIIARVSSMIRLNEEYNKNIKLENQLAKHEITALTYKLETNSSALMASKLRLIENAQNTSEYIADLQKLREHVSIEGNKIITQIISNCKTNSFKVNWLEFEMLFEKVHPIFYNLLQMRFPDLSIGERKICAMIKLNLTTKEISAITGQEIETVKKAKYRLKTKFNIDSMDTLYHYIQQID